ncbi:hypothetical protein LTR95_003625 [Oleoguttula sp. CCFEE 5521]
MRTNFTQCAADYAKADASTIALYGWTGNVVQIPKNETTQISTWGCHQICGSGNDWYEWSQVSNTITTWVLPVVGIILQAPFVSNAFWETVFSLSRWLGSPMASLAYIFWNIKVSGKCALLVDLAVPYDHKVTDGRVTDSDQNFLSIRDSFYLLMTMNQFTMRPLVREKKGAEALLRVVLFSKDLRLLRPGKEPQGRFAPALFDVVPGQFGVRTPAPVANTITFGPDDNLEPEGELNRLRQGLAQKFRDGRKRGVVPVFISTLWFLFALALSIQSAFGYLGSNAQAHDLALGCLLSWLPVLILSSIVDRNPVAADATRKKLNHLVDRVRQSLMDDTIRERYLRSIADFDQHNKMRESVEDIGEVCQSLGNFFDRFAGQARRRWHYGAAHPILSDIESAYIAEQGRNWLANEEQARNKLVLGEPEGLDWLDPRELWQVLSAVMIVGGSCLGAFVLSYYTPTVGLGCRSGGYTIFGSMAFILLSLEIVSWWVFDASKPGVKRIGEEVRKMSASHPSYLAWEKRVTAWYNSAHENAASFDTKATTITRHGLEFVLDTLASQDYADGVKKALRAMREKWQDMKAQDRLDCCFFKPVETINAVWLVYITIAQTSGAYRNCDCMSSLWGGAGGYIDWNNYDTATSSYVHIYWTTGTVIASTTMTAAMLYLMLEWCLQSHINTASIEDAATGLQRTRCFRWITSPYRMFVHVMIEGAYSARLWAYKMIKRMFGGKTKDARRAGQDPEAASRAGRTPEAAPRAGRRSVRWTSENGRNKTIVGQPATSTRHNEETPSEVGQPLITVRDVHGRPMAIRAGDDYSRSSVSISPGASRAPSIEGRASLQVVGQRAPCERQASQGGGV